MKGIINLILYQLIVNTKEFILIFQIDLDYVPRMTIIIINYCEDVKLYLMVKIITLTLYLWVKNKTKNAL